jgi:hypothetical protein
MLSIVTTGVSARWTWWEHMLQCLLHLAQILMQQAQQKDLAPQVLAKDSAGANHHYKTSTEVTSKETSKQIVLHSTSKWQLLEWLVKVWKGEEGKRKVVSPFSFFKSLFIFLFYQMQKWAKINMQWKRRKEHGGFGGDRENSNWNGGRRVEKKMG